MPGNMESMLMADDSSSGESDDEKSVSITAAPPPAAAPAPAPSPKPAAAAPAPSPKPAPTGGKGSQIARLKSLYSSGRTPTSTTTADSSSGNATGSSSSSAPAATTHQTSAPTSRPVAQAPPPAMQAKASVPPPAPAPSGHSSSHGTPGRSTMPPGRPHPRSMPPQQAPQPLPRAPPQRLHHQQQPPPQHPSHQPRQQHPSHQQHPSQRQTHAQQRSYHPQTGAPVAQQDPFAPTPLNLIREREEQKKAQQQQQQQQRRHHHHASQQAQMQQQQQRRRHPNQQQPQASGLSMPHQQRQPSGSQSSSTHQRTNSIDERKRKEKFLMFTRVLIKYLEQKDQNLHQRAKLTIKECAEKNKRGVPGYQSVTSAMETKLKALVGENYWQRAQAYLEHFLKQKQKAAASGSASRRPQAGQMRASSSSRPGHQQQVQAQQQRQEQMQKLQQAKLAKQKQQQQQRQAAAQSGTPTLQQMQRDIANQKANLQSSTSSSSGKQSSGKGTSSSSKKPAKRKSSSSSKKSSGAAAPGASMQAAAQAAAQQAAAAAEPVDPNALPPREYNELMEMVDHAIDYDWTTAGLLLGSKTDLELTEEQRNLVYRDNLPPPQQPPTAQPTQPPPSAEESSEPEPSGSRPGWDKRNVVSSRTAWAAIRLKEHEQQQSSQPIVGDVGLTLPGSELAPGAGSGTNGQQLPDTSWVNEEKAEKDTALAMLSEGTEIYLRGILEKAIHCARQRYNLDGIRLWHQQYTYAKENKDHKGDAKGGADGTSTNGKTTTTTTTTSNGTTTTPGDENGSKQKKESTKKSPPLNLRLGCDVTRQFAQAAGNAAMTVKRMEQALERQPGISARARVLEGETMEEATSMADLALRPQLAKGVATADDRAKRSYEIYGGKEATEPPLGRVPKQAKLESVDLFMASNITQNAGRHRASNLATSIFF